MGGFVGSYWFLIPLLAAAVLVFAFGIGRDAPVARRVFGRFLLYIALPLLVILGTPLLFLAAFASLGEALWQAIIAGVVIATGWLTTAIFNELAKAQAKAERLRDYHKAIFAEIRDSLAILNDEGQAEEDVARILDNMQRDPNFVPFIPREHHDFIYNAIIGEIEVLPRQTIDAIVAYYSQIKTVAALAEDMRGDRFHAIEQPRRMLVYRDFVEMRRRAFELGDYALKLIEEFSRNGPEAADRLALRLSSPDAAPNDPSPGSE